MSTRGCVAVGTLKSWRGVYNHFDSYPTGLGEEVWKEIQKQKHRLDSFCKELLKFDDWRAYFSKGVCQYCGKTAGQPHSINGRIIGLGKEDLAGSRIHYGKPDSEIQANLDKTGVPDPEAKYHAHNEGALKKHQITHKNGDPLFIEWVYVVDPKKRELHILAGKQPEAGDEVVGPADKKNGYAHVHKGTVSVDGTVPDWEKISKYNDEE